MIVVFVLNYLCIYWIGLMNIKVGFLPIILFLFRQNFYLSIEIKKYIMLWNIYVVIIKKYKY